MIEMKKRLAERMLEAELNHHLAQQNAQGQTGNHRNGSSAKTVIPPAGDVPLEIPRARLSTFEPVRIAKYHSGACLVLIRDEGRVKNKAVYSCVGDSSRWMQGSVGALD